MNLSPHQKLGTLFSRMRHIRIYVFVVAIFTIGMLVFGQVFAASGVPQIINFQGRLLDSGGNLLGGTSGTNYCFRFSLYDSASGGTKLWPASTPSTMTLPVRQGVFDANIGDTSAGGDALTYNFQDSSSTYVNVEVAQQSGGSCSGVTFETLTPRQQIVSSGYAINSGTVAGFTAAQSASGNEIPALTSGALVLGDAAAAIQATGSTALTIQGGGATGNIQFFSTSNTLDSSGDLTLAGTLKVGSLSGVLMASGGTVSGGATTDNLPQGSTNLYFTPAAAVTALTGQNVSIFTNNAGYLTSSTGQTPLTFSTGLTNTSGTVTVNTSQNISTLSNLTTNGLIKTSGGTGALSIAVAGTDYLAPTGSGTGLTGVALLGSPNTFTAANTISSAPFTISGNQTNSAWTTNGTQLSVAAATLTDSSSTGTVTTTAANSFGAPTLAASNTGVTYTNAATMYIAGTPTAGTNVTISIPYALYINSGMASLNGGISTLNASTGANFYASAGQSNNVSSIGTASLLFGGASAINVRSLFDGLASSTLTTNDSYSNVIIGSAPVTTPTTGTNTMLANLVVNPIGTVTSGGAAITNTASLYVNGASSAGTNNYALYVNSGTSSFGGFGLFNAGFGTTSTNSTANFITSAASSLNTGATATPLLFGGASSVGYRSVFNGSVTSALTTGSAYANVIVGSSPVTTFTSGTHAVLANFVVNPIGTITNAGATVTNTASLYVNGAGTGGTNNYAIDSNSGSNYFGGLVGLNSAVPTNTLTLGSGATGIALYNTADQTTNYEKVVQSWVSNVFTIASSAGGTGTVRNIVLSLPSKTFTLNNAGGFSGIFNFTSATGSAGSIVGITNTSTASSGTPAGLAVLDTLTETGTAGYRGLWISPFESTVGSGTRYLIDAGTNSAAAGAGTHTSKFVVTDTGFTGIGAGAPSSLLDLSGNITASAWGTNGINFQTAAATYTDSSTAASTTVTNNMVNTHGVPTLAATNTAVTYTNAATMYIAGAPSAGTNVTITNPYALYVNSGNSSFTGAIFGLGGISTTSTLTTSNFAANAGTGVGGTAVASAQFGGSSIADWRVLLNSGGTSTLALSANYSNMIIGSSPVTTAASGTNAWVNNLTVNAVGTITNGASGAPTNTASLYINGAATTGTNNYALDVASGLSQFGSTSVTTGTTIATFTTAGGTCNIVPSTTGGITCSSDMNLKKNITLLADNSAWSFNSNVTPASQSVLDKVLALTPVDYNWNVEQNTDPKHAGFIAQEVQQVFPDLVSVNPSTNLLSLDYTGLVPYTIEAIQEMNMNVTDIADLTRPNDWRDALLAWLGSATNGITNIFSQTVTTNTLNTQQLCVGPAGSQTCVTQSQLQQLLQNGAQSSNPNAPMNTTVTNPPPSDPDTSTDSAPTNTDTSDDTSTQTPAVTDTTVAPPASTDTTDTSSDDTTPSDTSDTTGQ